VHGTEAVIAAGLLNDLLASPLLQSLPSDMNAILVHVLNPWGMAHETRTTENNVDLNRNFIDFSEPVPRNPGYADLHSIISRSDIEAAIGDLRKALAAPGANGNGNANVDSIMRGQYEFADGINYGGSAEEWSNRTLRIILATHLPMTRHLALIDWHTGIGKPAEAVPLAFHLPGSRSALSLSKWHGKDVTLLGSHFPGGAVPRFTGILNMAVPAILESVSTYATVVEFGTKPNADVLEALMVDRWLKFAGADSTAASRLKRSMLDCFSPRDPKWRAVVVQSARDIVSRTIAGLAAEPD
jgi:hypothetical protein